MYQDWQRSQAARNLISSTFKKGRDLYEASNILERWFLGIFNNQSGATRKMASEFVEKHLVTEEDITQLVNRLSDVWTMEFPTHSLEVKLLPHGIKVNELTYPVHPDRLSLLLGKGTEVDIANCALRYATVSGRDSYQEASQQWSIPRHVYDLLVKEYGVELEGFASPFNSQLIRMGKPFCSLFPEDKVFGSMGNFFATNLGGKTVMVNPPFVPALLERTVEKCLLDMRDTSLATQLFVLVPSWTDAIFYQQLDKNKRLSISWSKYWFENILGEHIPAKFQTTLFILSNLPEIQDFTSLQKAFSSS